MSLSLSAAAVVVIFGIACYVMIRHYGGMNITGSKSTKIIEVPLDEVAIIWTQYNDQFDTKSVKKVNKISPQEQVDLGEGPEDESGGVEVMEAGGRLSPISKLKRDFWETCIEPYKDLIEMQNVSDIVTGLMEVMEKHGQEPSVVMDNQDIESNDLVSVRDNLGKVTIEEHSYAVVKNLIYTLKDSVLDYENHIPKAIVTALAHDIGKISEYRLSNAYNTHQHAMVGANKLAEYFIGKDIFWSKSAVKAVEEHHIMTSDQFTNHLIRADRDARRMELLRFMVDYEIRDFDKWFDVTEFMKRLNPVINVGQTYKKWQAFTYKGVLFCKPGALYEIARKYCREKKVLDTLFMYQSAFESAVRKIIGRLRDEGMVADYLQLNKITRLTVVYFKVGMNLKLNMVPLKIPEMYNIIELEQRKSDNLTLIEKVVMN